MMKELTGLVLNLITEKYLNKEYVISNKLLRVIDVETIEDLTYLTVNMVEDDITKKISLKMFLELIRDVEEES